MGILWPQTSAHYWLGLLVWIVVGVSAAVAVVRNPSLVGEDFDASDGPRLAGPAAAVVAMVAFGWPVEQWVVYAVAVVLVIYRLVLRIASGPDHVSEAGIPASE